MDDAELLVVIETGLSALATARAEILNRNAEANAKRLVMAIHAEIGPKITFTSAQLINHIRTVGECALREALDRSRVNNARKLGRLLASLEGREIEGLVHLG